MFRFLTLFDPNVLVFMVNLNRCDELAKKIVLVNFDLGILRTIQYSGHVKYLNILKEFTSIKSVNTILSTS